MKNKSYSKCLNCVLRHSLVAIGKQFWEKIEGLAPNNCLKFLRKLLSSIDEILLNLIQICKKLQMKQDVAFPPCQFGRTDRLDRDRTVDESLPKNEFVLH